MMLPILSGHPHLSPSSINTLHKTPVNNSQQRNPEQQPLSALPARPSTRSRPETIKAQGTKKQPPGWQFCIVPCPVASNSPAALQARTQKKFHHRRQTASRSAKPCRTRYDRSPAQVPRSNPSSDQTKCSVIRTPEQNQSGLVMLPGTEADCVDTPESPTSPPRPSRSRRRRKTKARRQTP